MLECRIAYESIIAQYLLFASIKGMEFLDEIFENNLVHSEKKVVECLSNEWENSFLNLQ